MVISLAADSAGNLYLGANDGHIFGSQDRGAHWRLLGRVGNRTDAVVAQLVVSPRNPRRLFAGIWFREAGAGGGIFQSEDGGATWQPSGLQGEAVRALEFAPSQAHTLVAGTRGGVFRTSDGGDAWERISPPDDPELRNVDSVAIDPADPLVIYAGTYHLPWKTNDGGKSWRPVSAGLIDDSDIMSMRVDAADPARLYLSACSGIYRSENRGEAWTKLQGIPYAARRTHAIVQDPWRPATLYAATTEGLWVTRDSGESWERTTPREWVVNGVTVLPAQGDAAVRVVIGTEAQGVLVSDDAGKTFHDSNRGFTHQVVKQLAGDPRDPSRLLLLRDTNIGELLESRDSGKSWSALPAVAPKGRNSPEGSAANVARVYGSPWGWLTQLLDGTLWIHSAGGGWQPWTPRVVVPRQAGKKKSASRVAAQPVKLGPPGTLAFSQEEAFLPASRGVLRCNRAGRCESESAFSKISQPRGLWVIPQRHLLAVVDGEKLGYSSDFGSTAAWRDLPAGIRGANVLLLNAASDGALFLATNRGLYFSPDAGLHWKLSQGGLPEGVVENVWSLARGLLVSLQEGGVYASPDGLGNWSRLDRDAERGRMNGLVETQPGLLLFGSQSEGLLRWSDKALPGTLENPK